MAKTKPVTLTIDTDIAKQGKEQAAKYGQSFSNYVQWLIVDNVEKINRGNRLIASNRERNK